MLVNLAKYHVQTIHHGLAEQCLIMLHTDLINFLTTVSRGNCSILSAVAIVFYTANYSTILTHKNTNIANSKTKCRVISEKEATFLLSKVKSKNLVKKSP